MSGGCIQGFQVAGDFGEPLPVTVGDTEILFMFIACALLGLKVPLPGSFGTPPEGVGICPGGNVGYP